MSSPLYRFFESLSTEASLAALVHVGREEDLYLEFKQKEDTRNGDLSTGDSQAFSKGLSGFGNADGGILIFGIRTTKGAEGIDRATALKPITDHVRFRGRLMDSILMSTQPVVDDVQIESVASVEGSGYVKVFVPQSVKPPHRAMLSGREYWRRVSTGHRRMEHYELEDIFGRRQRPVLKVRVEVRPRPGNDPHEEVHFFLLNEGRGVARHGGFNCRFGNEISVVQAMHGIRDATRVNLGAATITYTNDSSVIHPNGISTAAGHATVLRESKGLPMTLKLTWYAEGIDAGRAECSLSPGIIQVFG